MERSEIEGTWDGSRLSPALTVDEEEEDVADSRTAVKPRVCMSSGCGTPGNFLLVTGGRLRVGLVACRDLRGALTGVPIPGDCDDIEVGVEVRLKAPGDSERRVDELLSCTWVDVGER